MAEGICPADQFRCGNGDCISLKLRCDGFNDCGDNSDEGNCQFYTSKRCALENKNCSDLNQKKHYCSFGSCSQKCIEKKNSYSCQCEKGYTLTFEETTTFKMKEGTKEKSKNYKPGSSDKKDSRGLESEKKGEFSDVHKSCKAMGSEAGLIVIRDTDMAVLSPYKSRGSERQLNLAKTNLKIKNVDVLYNDSQITVFFTDYVKKTIMRMIVSKDDLNNSRLKREIASPSESTPLPPNPSCDLENILLKQNSDIFGMKYADSKREINYDFIEAENLAFKTRYDYKMKKQLRFKRDSDTLKLVVGELHDPKGLAIDWVVGRLYYIDKIPNEKSAFLMASTLNGRKKTTIIKTNLIEPMDLALEPKMALLFFTDCNLKFPKIERSFMDGSHRKLVVSKDVVCPSGISIDYPSSVLYFVDTKLNTLESVDFNGDNRMVVKAFNKDSFRPYKLEIFEDFAYISSYQNENVLRMNKFGRGETKNVIQGVRNRMSDIVIFQENKQEKGLLNPCPMGSCHESSLCVIGSSNTKTNIVKKSCLCPDGLQKTVLANSTVSKLQ